MEARIATGEHSKETVWALNKKIFGGELDEQEWQNRMCNTKKRTVVVLAFENQTDMEVAVGFLLAHERDGNTMNVWLVGVLEPFRRRGHFSKLTKTFLAGLQKNDAITVTTHPARFPEMYALLQRHAERQPRQKGDADDKVRFRIASASMLRDKLVHCSLRREARLVAVVNELMHSCPWTATEHCPSMVKWMRSELDEVSRAIADLESQRGQNTNGVGNHGALSKQQVQVESAKAGELISELGDVLFDALMINAVVSRDFALDPGAAWTSAIEKVERRTPYVPLWGDGSIARTAEEATAHWMAAKKSEKNDKGKKIETRLGKVKKTQAYKWLGNILEQSSDFWASAGGNEVCDFSVAVAGLTFSIAGFGLGVVFGRSRRSY